MTPATSGLANCRVVDRSRHDHALVVRVPIANIDAGAKLTRRDIAARLLWRLICAYCPLRSGRA
jgi:hypothetical protein